jgi:sulfite exporter TauE/SafE
VNSAFALAFVVGLLSALHCVGMCGGIVGALTFSLPQQTRSRWTRLTLFLFAYNLGRTSSYAIAGAAIGSLGAALLGAGVRSLLHGGLRWVAAVVVVGIGLHIAGWLPRIAGVERLGEPLWRRLEPIGRRLLPVRTLPRALLYGSIWGWLPCGLVYTMLISVPAQGDATAGALYMASFGLGTLPVMLATGLAAGKLHRFASDERLRVAAGLAVVALGAFALYFPRIQ